jgi:hypothetical protein
MHPLKCIGNAAFSQLITFSRISKWNMSLCRLYPRAGMVFSLVCKGLLASPPSSVHICVCMYVCMCFNQHTGVTRRVLAHPYSLCVLGRPPLPSCHVGMFPGLAEQAWSSPSLEGAPDCRDGLALRYEVQWGHSARFPDPLLQPHHLGRTCQVRDMGFGPTGGGRGALISTAADTESAIMLID